MNAFLRSATLRTGTHALTGLALLLLLAGMGCAELTGPDPVDPADYGIEPVEDPDGPYEVVFSLNTLDMEQLASIVEVDDGVSGPRWCGQGFWVDADTDPCNGHRPDDAMGEVSLVDGQLRVAAGVTRGAPFLWTGGPSRQNPFPESGDFAIDVRMTMEQLAGHGTGIWVLDWQPAEVAGSNSPLVKPVLRLWGDNAGGVRAILFGKAYNVRTSLTGAHWYHLSYEDGHYTLSVDGEVVAGPVAHDRRPNAAWLGNPIFADWGAGDWTDFLLAEFTVTAPAVEPEEITVSVDVKPGGCDSPLQLTGRGVVPAAILGQEGLDVTQIDPATIRLEGVTPLRSSLEDVGTAGDCDAGPDGIEDLTIKFDNAELTKALEDAGAVVAVVNGQERVLTLKGYLRDGFDGTAITGQDVVIIQKP